MVSSSLLYLFLPSSMLHRDNESMRPGRNGALGMASCKGGCWLLVVNRLVTVSLAVSDNEVWGKRCASLAVPVRTGLRHARAINPT
ncbi:hypothetical protein ARMGADRAFT_102894 [Armillaria gallica]|uniref:Uncharacterized protein n=1 Tax=Armillaria gallica TaxID=47427 RepID=A0A2H3CEQ9_ARMGA|nr:hypothetical protein ARMGADRAFT_102894 [Armillaria gallica]